MKKARWHGTVSAVLILAGVLHAEEQGTEWKDAGRNPDVARILAKLDDGAQHQHVMMPMRDGTNLATEVFLPPGKGPWPVVLMRTPYGRFNVENYAARVKGQACAFVAQDPRGDGDSEGRDSMDPVNSENEIADGYDCVEWIARQPWCNGRVGMYGGSGHGMCACMAYLSGAPHLVVVNPGNTAGNTAMDWAFENGVRRNNYGWLVSRGMKVQDWPKPTLFTYDARGWAARLPAFAETNRTVFIVGDGWYNIFGDASLQWFGALADKGKVFISMGPGTHGKADGLIFPQRAYAKAEPVPSFFEILRGSNVTARSHLTYFMMGDARDPAAPGCAWKLTDRWPVAATTQRLHLHADGTLQRAAPMAPGRISYRYNPRDPAPTVGGHHFYGQQPAGALDQRPLTNRSDVIRFLSAPLEEPLAVTGNPVVELCVQADVDDTMLVLKLVDVYPDGTETLIRESAFMTRYRDGLDKPAPMTKNAPCSMRLTMAATSIAFNRGHRIGLLITSSSTPAYEVHPNSYAPVMSFNDAPIATITIGSAPDAPSALLLPVVEP